MCVCVCEGKGVGEGRFKLGGFMPEVQVLIR